MSFNEIEIRDVGRWSTPSPTPSPKPSPEPEPKPKLVTWRLCVLIPPEGIDCGAHYVNWYPSGDIREDWYPIEAHTQPVETVKQLPEGQRP